MNRSNRWDRAGQLAAYGAALALTPYLLIKTTWVVGSLLGLLPIGTGFDTAEWVALNTTTIGMAAIGITVALSLVRPWGMRIPSALLVFCAWVGSGFLVPLLPYAVLSSVLSPGNPDAKGDDSASMPGWEAALVQIGFVGMGLGLAIALPAHLRRRWPDAFSGLTRPEDRALARPAGARPPWTALAASAVATIWFYWAAGGPLGVGPSAERDTNWRVLTGISAFWALAAAAAAWALARRGPARLPRWLPLALGWIGSGSLFAWSGWKLPITLYIWLVHPVGTTLPENYAVAVAVHATAVVTGAAMLRPLLSRLAPATTPATAADPAPLAANR